MAENSIRHHLTAAARDIAVLGSVSVALLSGAIGFTRPYWEPFASLPKDVATIQQQIVSIQSKLSEGLSPEIVTFSASFAVESEIRQGGTLPILFFLRRNASCQTEIRPSFYNIDQNFSIGADTFLAERAPVTNEKILFQVRVPIPDNVPPGRYIYNAELSPIDCGIYGPMRAIPSQPFTVLAQERNEQ